MNNNSYTSKKILYWNCYFRETVSSNTGSHPFFVCNAQYAYARDTRTWRSG